MANRPRWWKENTIYSETKRTVDRQFLLRPCPEIRNMIGACIGRALRKFPVKLHWVEAPMDPRPPRMDQPEIHGFFGIWHIDGEPEQ